MALLSPRDPATSVSLAVARPAVGIVGPEIGQNAALIP